MKKVLLLQLIAVSAAADVIDVSLDGKAMLGEGTPTLVLQINDPISGFELALTRSDGKEMKFRGGGRPGTTRRVPLEQPPGKFRYKGTLTAQFPNGESAAMPLEFETEAQGPPSLSLPKSALDLDARTLTFSFSRPIAKAHLVVTSDTGKTIVDTIVPFNQEPAGSALKVKWPAHEGRVMKISLQAYDPSEFFTGVEVFPWQIDIPHEDVHFETARFDIPAAERPKLETALSQISDALAKYGRFAAIKLYVVGHTDTVGNAESNRTLSMNRARSIAAYFRKRGLKIPVFYAGLGEEALAAVTADEVDEAKNRRAEYILAIDPPTLKGATEQQLDWKKL